MTQPLTPEQIQIVRHCAWNDADARAEIFAVLDRLHYLERKLLAAEQLARRLATSNCLMVGISKTHDAQIKVNRQAIDDYDEVTDEDTVPGMEP